ncbi:MAG: hypothetical protein JXB48_15845 [Candidatus Latescibacteria bacterium]|nr:hypothetical protein [Candidatus Latescibacterota bacterium]
MIAKITDDCRIPGQNSMNVDSLIDFENDPRLLEFKLSHDNIHIWPLVRFNLFRHAFAAMYNLQTAHAGSETISLIPRLKYLFQSIQNNPLYKAGKHDIIIIGSGAGIVAKRDGKWFDRINDYFALENEHTTVVFDEAYRLRYKSPRYPENVRYLDFIEITSKLLSILFPAFIKTDYRCIERFISFVINYFPYPLSGPIFKDCRKYLSHIAVSLRFYHFQYQFLFKKIRPLILFIEDASYGGKAYLLKWAKEAGIITAEFQHGNIIPNHLAYNYGSELLNNGDFGKYLPDYLLLYGEYYLSCIRTSSKGVIIGCPHFSSQFAVKNSKSKIRQRRMTILVVSQGTITSLMVELTIQLIIRLPENKYRLIFRLHPGEVPFEERYRSLLSYPIIELSKTGDIYELINISNYVVGSSSTALIEAMGFSKEVYIYECTDSLLYMPRQFAVWFKTADELCEALKSGNYRGNVDPEYYWAKDWKENYREFINEKVMKRY